MPLKQFARGLWASFGPVENPFTAPNGMEQNLRLIDDNIGLYTMLPPQPVGTAKPAVPNDGDGQIYKDGTYAVYNGGSWKGYSARPGMKAAMIDGSDLWYSTATGGWVNTRKTLQSMGAAGTGAGDDRDAIAAAIANAPLGGEIQTDGLNYLTTAYSNPLGIEFAGGGALLRQAPQGGLVQINSKLDDGKLFIGKEYLYRLYLRLSVGGTLSAFIYGDSTVATSANGGGYAGAAFEPQALLTAYLARKRVRNAVTIVNRGVGGTRVSQMNAMPDIDSVNGSTDLMIIKYGINDAQDGPAGFANNLRAKLAQIRANPYATPSNLSIVLVGPSATYDPGHGRASPWYEKLRPIYVQAARDFQCAFFDTYAYLRDVSWGAGTLQDNPFGNGQGVHPGAIMQNWIWAGVCDAMLGESDLMPYVDAAPITNEWKPLLMRNNWHAYGGGFAQPYACISMDGWVSVRGLIGGGSVGGGAAVAQLPETGMYPQTAEIFEVACASGRCAMRVNIDGNIEQQDVANASYTSISGIRFRAHN